MALPVRFSLEKGLLGIKFLLRCLTMIKVCTFSGKELNPYLEEIARLRMEVFKEWPYLYEGNFGYEKSYLKKFSHCEESVFVVAFDNGEVIGISSGLPLCFESEVIQKPFVDKQLPIDHYFYFSESVLKKAYRGQGLGHAFFDAREAFVKELGSYPRICFCSIIREPTDSRKPKEYWELGAFWRARGFAPLKGVICRFSWDEVGQKEKTEKELQFWAKDLT
ncbi:MAG: hypothetical protein S4CHLAM123_11430 [Chlamydiales bacterium]|nr:hypothetical protein [Chlamydiales bacterium]